MHAQTHTHARTNTHIHTQTHTFKHIHTHTFKHIHIRTGGAATSFLRDASNPRWRSVAGSSRSSSSRSTSIFGSAQSTSSSESTEAGLWVARNWSRTLGCDDCARGQMAGGHQMSSTTNMDGLGRAANEKLTSGTYAMVIHVSWSASVSCRAVITWLRWVTARRKNFAYSVLSPSSTLALGVFHWSDARFCASLYATKATTGAPMSSFVPATFVSSRWKIQLANGCAAGPGLFFGNKNALPATS